MPVYISILRGINVSGHKKILMADLKKLYEKLEFEKITTFIQSGNVVFSCPVKKNTSALASEIAKSITAKYNFNVPVIVLSRTELEKSVSANPFVKEKKIDEAFLHITFLAEVPAKDAVAAMSKIEFPPDRFVISGREVYLYCPGGYGNTKLSNTFFENKLKTTATTRNWKTVNKLAEIAAETDDQ